MTHQEKLAFIRGKVIEAVPKIVELTMGCEIERPGTGYIESIMLMEAGVFMRWCATIYRSTLKLKYTYELTEYELETWRVIGRPIRLADVLLAIGRRQDRIHLSCDGWFCVLQDPMREFVRRVQWNLLAA